jgi:hypothetical protein
VGLNQVRQAPSRGLPLEEGGEEAAGYGNPGRVFGDRGVSAGRAERAEVEHVFNVAPSRGESARLVDEAAESGPGLFLERRVAQQRTGEEGLQNSGAELEVRLRENPNLGEEGGGHGEFAAVEAASVHLGFELREERGAGVEEGLPGGVFGDVARGVEAEWD